ncbi:MAG TPA: hypothetical protein VKR58_04085 [Aquella sp.]|nr:hypothetical protein [Aquella sp.]
MSKTFQHFLFGFGSVLNIFGGNSHIQNLRGGYITDYEKLKNSGRNIMKNFGKVVHEYKEKPNRS